MRDINTNRVLIVIGADHAPAPKTVVFVGDLIPEIREAGWLVDRNPFGTWIIRKTLYEERTRTVVLRYPGTAFRRELEKDYGLEGDLYCTSSSDVRELLADLPEWCFGPGEVYRPNEEDP